MVLQRTPGPLILAGTASWTRYCLCSLAARAAEVLAKRETDLLRSFLQGADLSSLETAAPELRAIEQRLRPRDLQAVMRWIREAATPSDLAPVALSGRPELVSHAVREAGVAAFTLPWVCKIVEAWRWIATGKEYGVPREDVLAAVRFAANTVGRDAYLAPER